MRKIFTFWEPKENIPGYINLCMKTWKKYLNGYEIVVCDYSNIKDYLPSDVIEKCICKKMSLAMQSDAIRAALINFHGGIWIDADTIITSERFLSSIRSYKSDCLMIGDSLRDTLYGAFIYSSSPKVKFMNKWYETVIDHVSRYRKAHLIYRLTRLMRKEYKRTHNWDWCVNAIIDPLQRDMTEKDFKFLDKNIINALPETNINLKEGQTQAERYQSFYFTSNERYINIRNEGIILLHNSWTPEEFRRMTEEEFLKTDILLAEIIKKVLND